MATKTMLPCQALCPDAHSQCMGCQTRMQQSWYAMPGGGKPYTAQHSHGSRAASQAMPAAQQGLVDEVCCRPRSGPGARRVCAALSPSCSAWGWQPCRQALAQLLCSGPAAVTSHASTTRAAPAARWGVWHGMWRLVLPAWPLGQRAAARPLRPVAAACSAAQGCASLLRTLLDWCLVVQQHELCCQVDLAARGLTPRRRQLGSL
jgi:hypothetical protein